MAKGAQKSDKASRARNLILGFTSLLIAAILSYGLYTVYFAGAPTDGEFAAGTHFDIIENPLPRRPTEPISVYEFFSYGCVHCKNFDPLIDAWKETLPEDVVFERKPASFNPIWEMLGRTYYTLIELDTLDRNHQRLFRAIHDNGRQFLSAQMLADFCTDSDADSAEFLEIFNSAGVRRQMTAAAEEMRALGVNAVPTLVVAGKYAVRREVGRAQSLDVVNYLLELERTGGQGEAP